MKMILINLLVVVMMTRVSCVDKIRIISNMLEPIIEGEEELFYCTTNLEKSSIWNWKKDGKIIEIGVDSNYQVEFFEDASLLTLKIKKIKIEDANYNFQCCYGEGGNERCKKLTLPTILEVPHDTYPTCELDKNPATVGEEVTVECCCEVIKPMPLLTWVGIESERYSRDQLQCIKHTFQVERRHEEGTITCQMTMNLTRIMQRTCTSGKIQVLYKPVVKLQADLPFQIDTEVVLICFAEADPDDKKYRWSFDRPLYHEILKENEMVIHLIFSKSDEGILITCEVENSIGRGKANLTVEIASTSPTARAIPKKLGSMEPPTKNQDSTILAIVGVSLLFVSFLIAAALCYFVMLTPTPRHPLDYTGGVIPQPDIYFEPKDNIMGSSTSTGKRHVGIQVPGGPDSEPFYMEVPGSDKGSQSHYATSRSVYV